MDPRNQISRSKIPWKRYVNSNGIALVMCLEERIDNRWTALRSGHPGDTRNRGRPRARWRDGLDSFAKHCHRIAQNIDQWRTMGKAFVQRRTFNGWKWTELNWNWDENLLFHGVKPYAIRRAVKVFQRLRGYYVLLLVDFGKASYNCISFHFIMFAYFALILR